MPYVLIVLLALLSIIIQIASCRHATKMFKEDEPMAPSALTRSWEDSSDYVHLYLKPIDADGHVLKAQNGGVISMNYLDKLAEDTDTDELPVLHLQRGTALSEAKYMSIVGHLSDLNYRIIAK